MNTFAVLAQRADEVGVDVSEFLTPASSIPKFMTYEAFSDSVEDIVERYEAAPTSVVANNDMFESDDDIADLEDMVGLDTTELLRAMYFMEDSLSSKIDALTNVLSSFGEKSLFIQQSAYDVTTELSETFRHMLDLDRRERLRPKIKSANVAEETMPVTIENMEDFKDMFPDKQKGFAKDCCCDDGGMFDFDFDSRKRRRNSRYPDYDKRDYKKKPSRWSRIKDGLKGTSGRTKAVAAIAASLGGLYAYDALSSDSTTVAPSGLAGNVPADDGFLSMFGMDSTLGATVPLIGGLGLLSMINPGSNGYRYDSAVSAPMLDLNPSAPIGVEDLRKDKPALPAPKPVQTPKASLLSKVGNGAKRVPVVGTALGALDAYTIVNDDKLTGQEKTTQLTGVAGGMAGGWAGAQAGAAGGAALGGAIGSLFFGVGAAPGAAIGGILGGLAGGFGGYSLGEFASEAVADSMFNMFENPDETNLVGKSLMSAFPALGLAVYGNQAIQSLFGDDPEPNEHGVVLSKQEKELAKEYEGKPWMFNEKGVPYAKHKDPQVQAKMEKAYKRVYDYRANQNREAYNYLTDSDAGKAAKPLENYVINSENLAESLHEKVEPTKEEQQAKAEKANTVTTALTPEQQALKTEYAGKPWMFDLEGIPLPKMPTQAQQQRYEAARKKIWIARNKAKANNAGITTVQSRQAQKNIEQVAVNSTGKQYQSDLDLPELDSTNNVAATKSVYENYVMQNNVQAETSKALVEPIDAVTSSPDVEPMNYVAMNNQSPVEVVQDVAQPIQLDLEALRPETAVKDSVQTMTAKLDTLKPAETRKLDYRKPAVVKQRTNDPVRLSDVPTIIDGGGIGLINLGVI